MLQIKQELWGYNVWYGLQRFKQEFNDKNKKTETSREGQCKVYNTIFSNKEIQSYINIFLYYGDSFYCDDKTLSYNLQVSLKLSRFISILLYNLE